MKKVVWFHEDCDNYFKDKMRITLEIVPTTIADYPALSVDYITIVELGNQLMVGGLIPIYEMPSLIHVRNCAKLEPVTRCLWDQINQCHNIFLSTLQPFACVLFVLVGALLEEMDGVCKSQGPYAQ